ncbi:MAG: regulatory protein RecX [Gammaproteobacteria bacterium]
MKRCSKLKPEQASDAAFIRKSAMDFLARREHSEAELRRKLATRGFDADLIETTLAGLVAENLLSNTRFAEAFVHSRYQRGSGPQKIHAELRERGIDDGLIEESIAGYDQQWRERVREVREKKFGAGLPGDYKERARQMRFLQQRGFTPEQISSVFKEA